MRYVKGLNDMPTKEEVSSDERYSKLRFKTSDPIDFEKVKSEIALSGPIEIIKPEGPVKFTIDIYPCQIQDCECQNDIISAEDGLIWVSIDDPKGHCWYSPRANPELSRNRTLE